MLQFFWTVAFGCLVSVKKIKSRMENNNEERNTGNTDRH